MTTLSTAMRSLVSTPSAASVQNGRKALAPRPLDDPVPAIFQQANVSRLSVGKAFDHLSAYAGKEAIDWVYDCTTLIAEAIQGADHHFERAGKVFVPKMTPGLDPSVVSEAPDDLVQLTTRPNPYTSWSDLLMLLVIDWLLIGNSFWYRFKPDAAGKPAAIYRLMPQYLQLVPGKTQLIEKYLYNVPGRGEPIEFAPDRVIHFRRPNPHSEYLGAGVIRGGARVFDMEIALTRSQAEYFEQGTRLSGVLESDRGVPRDVWKRTKAQFMSLYAGAGNAYKVAMLTHGMQFKPIQANAHEAEFGLLGDKSRDRILAMFRVPSPLLGLSGGYDRQAVREAQRIFDNKTVRPIADALQDTITLALTDAWGLEFKIDYEYEMPIEDRLELAVDTATLPGIKVDEVRETAGFKPLPRSEKGPDGKPIGDMILNLPGNDENASKVKDRPLGSEPGRPPNPENTRAFPREGSSTPRDAEARSAQKALQRADEAIERARAALAKAGGGD